MPQRTSSIRASRFALFYLALALVVAGCREPSLFAQAVEARQRVASLETHFARAVSASQRAVMSDDEPASARFKQEAEAERAGVERETRELAQLLAAADLRAEAAQLARIQSDFTAYRLLDRSVLGLAGEKTNAQAQRLSFGAARESADAFARSLEELVAFAPEVSRWQARAQARDALLAVREIQLLEGPHIREPDDAPMARMEAQMAAHERAAREALDNLAQLLPSAAGSARTAARDALDRFTQLHAQIVSLSRRNTNVRSLALTLGEKRTLTEACERGLHALRAALAKRVAPVSR